jgi:spore maturation protein CgeB
MPRARFLLGGSGWDDKSIPDNVERLGHVYTQDHNAFNSSARMVLNVARDSMAENGFSPATRIFEAAGAAACIVTDEWLGLEEFLEPENEVLVARTSEDVVDVMRRYHPDDAQRIGQNARRRVLAHHTYAHRAQQIDLLFTGSRPTWELGQSFCAEQGRRREVTDR